MTYTEYWVRGLIAEGQEVKFYKSKRWLAKRASVMDRYHYECQECLKRGKITRAKVVHHVNELKHRPDLALTEFYTDNDGNVHPNLVPLCQDCHNVAHKRICSYEYKPQLNEERW